MVGSGGTGVVALGEMLLRCAAKHGLYGILRKTFGPQIRGGESAAIVRLGQQPVDNFNNRIDVLLVLDWSNFLRFADEIPLTETTILVEDQHSGSRPVGLPDFKQSITLDFLGCAQALGSAHSNIAMLGYLAGWLGCSADSVESAIQYRLGKHAADTVALAVAVARQGAELHTSTLLPISPFAMLPLTPAVNTAQPLWLTTGNQLAGLGALEAGIRFVAAYPITPASDVVEWMAGQIEALGGHLVQAEDELAAVNMAIGAGFGGVPAMTATSGPGLALMVEAMGLAVASETPLVILDVMRGGPSTGIPTKSEQSDFNLAVYGLHGDAPHVVLCALSIADCHYTTAWATQIASQRQTLVLVLSDQFIGQSMQVMSALPETPFKAEIDQAAIAEGDEKPPYYRYLNTDSGISPVALPGQVGGMFTADGLEHSEAAVPSPKASDHEMQSAKRLRKLDSLRDADDWGEVQGDINKDSLLLVCWGSLYPVSLEAQQALRERGVEIVVLGVRLLSPLPVKKITQLMQQATATLVIEQNQQGQFTHYLRSLLSDAVTFSHYCRPGPRLFTPNEIIEQVEALVNA